jgi:hypothetical protein
MPLDINKVMTEAIGYRVTNTINKMIYNGIIYKDLDIARRFEEHMTGRGGVLLFENGVCKYGRECFTIEEVCIGSLEDIREWEYLENINNLWPVGYNGNAGKVIINTPDTKKKQKASFKRYLDNRTKEEIKKQNEKRANTIAKRSTEEIELIKQKLSAAGNKLWNSMNKEEKKRFLDYRGKRKSDTYKSQTEEYKQAIRNKIKNSMCKKQYKSPKGIFNSTVDGGRAEDISPALFNHRCKSKHYPEWEILPT